MVRRPAWGVLVAANHVKYVQVYRSKSFMALACHESLKCGHFRHVPGAGGHSAHLDVPREPAVHVVLRSITCCSRLKIESDAIRCPDLVMLRILSAASGHEVAALDAAFDALVEGGPSVGSLKRHLAEKHFKSQWSRFQMRILREGDPIELQDDESLTLPSDLQLMFLSHLPQDEERDQCFWRSCREGNLEEVQKNLKGLQNPNVKSRTCRNRSALCIAAFCHGYPEVVSLLLEAQADPGWVDDDGCGPLHAASVTNSPRVVRCLLEWGAEKETADAEGKSPLHFAAECGHLDVIRLLLDAGADAHLADVRGETPARKAERSGKVEALTLLRKKLSF